MTRIKIHIILIVVFILGCMPDGNATAYTKYFQIQPSQADTTQQDTTKVEKYEPSFRPTYKQQDRFGDPFSNTQSPSPLLLQDPSNLTLDVEIDTGMNYTIYEKVGGLNYRPRTSMSFDQFIAFQEQRTKKEYWKNRSAGLDGESAVSGRRLIPKLYISPIFDRIFGGNFVDIQPNGMVNMDFGGRWQKSSVPGTVVNQQRTGGFNYNQQISLNVVGKIGEKLAITANFDNNNTFDYQNNLKIEYTGYEEDIIKKIEIGNVSMPISNSLMTGGQSLFGIKTQLQFGKLYVTGLASRQQGSVKSESFNQNSDDINDITGIKVTEYDEYKHFFLGHFFRDKYEDWLEKLPIVTSTLMVQNIQVYVVKNSSNNQVSSRRSIVALTDLGEAVRIGNNRVQTGNFPVDNTDNEANTLYEEVIGLSNIRGSSEEASSALTSYGLVDGVDFIARDNVRQLDPTEYEVRKNLGYISLRSPLNEGEALAVSYEYTHNGGARPYQVGELSTANQDASSDQPLILKLLKSTRQNLDKPVWDLAMKNIYTLPGARGLQQADFKMQIVYEDNEINYRAPNLNEGTNTNNIPLLQVLKLDQLNRNQDSSPDANFDFIEDITFDPDYGTLIFPVLEPFGSTLEAAFTDEENDLKEKYVFNELYELPKKGARLVSLKNKFELLPEFEGRAQSEYLLEGFSILEGSVVVNSGSQVLTEGKDYQVTYLGGAKVIITNPSLLTSGKPITISYEEADVFNFSSKWLTGARLDYQLNEKINFGATVLHLSERTGGVSRYSIGNEPVKNTKYGFDVNFQEDSRIITKIIDALPLLSTKEKSTVTFNGEFAQLIPGTSNKVNGESTSYLEDFESAATLYQLGGGHVPWKLGSTPQGDRNLKYSFDKRVPNTDSELLGLGYKRAKLAWYVVDRSFYTDGGNRPDNIETSDLDNAYVKAVIPQDIFNIDGRVVNTNMSIFDLAYYPHERGPYNYNNNPDDYRSQGDGLFENPEESFGSISRLLPTNTDFASSNIEYMEFWLLDPFIAEEDGGRVLDGYFDQSNTSGGFLTFNLGLVSEDILEDNIPSFEHGLPPDGSDEGTKFNEWGRFTEQGYLTQFFDASPTARINQDVGLDGLNSERETNYYADHMNPLYESGKILDGFIQQEFEDDLSGDDFKFYLDPTYTTEKILQRYKDFNGMEGNSPSESGNSSFSSAATVLPDKEDLDQSDSPYASQVEEFFEYELDLRRGLSVNHPFIVDQVTDKDQHDWFLFRIPLQEPTGATEGATFGSVKDMRLFLTGWQEPVVLRMANFQMVSSQWRKYTGDLSTEGFGVVPPPAEADFEVSVVSIEQNGATEEGKTAYVVPPGIERDLDNTTAISRRVNEQSLKLCVEDLKEGDARGAFKTPVDVDLVNYKNLRMFFHAESVIDKSRVNDDDSLKAFLRLARDESENYYEIELNLKITELGETVAEAIWPEQNEIHLALNELYDLKSDRNRGQHPVTEVFSQSSQNGKYRLSIVGNPKLSNIQYMMIGVRNPKKEGVIGLEKSLCIWANELRVTGFDNQNGWAANARMNIQLADFATINGSTRYMSSGFGGLQDKIGERTREDNTQYDVSANIAVDKLIPWKTGVKIPMFLSHSKTKKTPRYDPLDNDTPLESTLRDFNSDEEREDYKQKVISQVTSKSINFIDVHKEKVKEDAKQHIYDIENFSFSYSYSEETSSNTNTAERLTKRYSGSIAYLYSPKAPIIEPFKNAEIFSSPYLQLIRDINFSLLPNNISARASIDRSFMRTQLRNASLSTEGITPNYEKLFYFDRTYSVRWNLFKNLSINYNAVTNAIIDEGEGDIDTQAERDAIWDNIKSMGRTKHFAQSIGANYRLPLDKIPLTDWISADYRYDVNYKWTGANQGQAEAFGNQVDNTRSQDLNGKFDLVRLYNKSSYLKSINTPPKRSRSGKPDTTQQASPIFKGLWRLIMSVRSINVTLSRREGTGLPGLQTNPYMFGLDSDFASPGLGFILGDQNPAVRTTAANNDWLVKSTTLSVPFMQTMTEEVNIKTTIEPFRDFRIQVDMRRSNSNDYQEFYKHDPAADQNVDNGFRSTTPARSGSYSITFMPISTSFLKGNGLESDIFNDFVANREIIQNRLSQANNGEFYGSNSHDVLIPAFIAAYSGKNASSVKTTPFPTIPMPNWRLDYAGLSKIPSLQNIFASVNLTHAYTSTFTISNYANSLLYTEANTLDFTNNIMDYPLASARDTNGDLVPLYLFDVITIAERFSPLIGINLRTKSMVSIKVEYSRERNVSMNVLNFQIADLKSNDVTFDLGIAKDQWKIPFKIQGRTVVVRNEIQFRLAFTVRDTRTIQRRIEEAAVITDGNLNYNVRPSIRYVANQKLNLTMYYDRAINAPKLSSANPRTATSFGVQLQFNLAQ